MKDYAQERHQLQMLYNSIAWAQTDTALLCGVLIAMFDCLSAVNEELDQQKTRSQMASQMLEAMITRIAQIEKRIGMDQ